MSTPLPPSKIEEIEKEAGKYAYHAHQYIFGEGWEGYKSGATAQALKAQVLVEALEKIGNVPYLADEREKNIWINTAREEAQTALKQYNETI